MIFSLDVRRARKGDCLILHYGTKSKPGLVLIDGGPAQVYGPHLKPRLEEIRKARRLAESEPLTVDLLMVSHVDDDHINGKSANTATNKQLAVHQNVRLPVMPSPIATADGDRHHANAQRESRRHGNGADH